MLLHPSEKFSRQGPIVREMIDLMGWKLKTVDISNKKQALTTF